MVITSEIAPSQALAPFIRSYAYREFDTNGTDLIKPWQASSEANIIFFFKDVPTKLTDKRTGTILKKGEMCDVVGMSTKYNGDMTFNGKYSFLQILFLPHGFHTLFNTSPHEIVDKIVWSGDIFKSDIKILHEKLFDTKSLVAMTELLNVWLLHYLNKKRRVDYKAFITAAANLIIKNGGLVNIESLAANACMSKRNFERIFINEIGMTAKELCCISRFNNALDLKLNSPSMNWTSIAHQSGFFDQMHLIKDFKRFCGEAPTSLLRKVPLLEEIYISRVK